MSPEAYDYTYGYDPLRRPIRRIIQHERGVDDLVCGHSQPGQAGYSYTRCRACGQEARSIERGRSALEKPTSLPWLASNLTEAQQQWLGFRRVDHPKYKYCSTAPHEFFFPELFDFFFPHLLQPKIICGGFVKLLNPMIIIESGYAWDGPSGPTIDSVNFLAGSHGHDGLYQGMRTGELPQGVRPLADRLMRRVNLDCGMSRFRAWYTWKGVRLFAAAFAEPKSA